VPRFLPG